jgi:hypothetical protein
LKPEQNINPQTTFFIKQTVNIAILPRNNLQSSVRRERLLHQVGKIAQLNPSSLNCDFADSRGKFQVVNSVPNSYTS